MDSASTRTNNTHPISACNLVSVIGGVGVSFRAMRLGGICRPETFASQHIYLMCNGLKMAGIHTSCNSAQVIQFPILRDRANEIFVSKYMRTHELAGAFENRQKEGSIASRCSANPEPASRVPIKAYFLKEPMKYGLSHWSQEYIQ